jgi:hypothetical protein
MLPALMTRGLAIMAAACLVGGCGGGQSAATTTSTVPPGTRVLNGCHSLPFSGGTAKLLPVKFYMVNATPTAICFRLLDSGSKCSPAPGFARSYGDPIVDTDEPRSGGYFVVYYPTDHRWLLVPQCPSG